METEYKHFDLYISNIKKYKVTGFFKRKLIHTMKVKLKVAQLCSTLCKPMDYTVHEILQARILDWVAFPFSRELSQPRNQTQGSNPGLLHCRQILYQLSHKGNPRILTGMGSLSLLQRIFPNQESNQSLMHCRWILPTELSKNTILSKINQAYN